MGFCSKWESSYSYALQLLGSTFLAIIGQIFKGKDCGGYIDISMGEVPISNICEFGHQMSWFLALFVILRSLFKNKFTKNISIVVLIITATFSMLNLNAVVYLIPHFVIEIYLIKNNFNL